jgi:zinc protease
MDRFLEQLQRKDTKKIMFHAYMNNSMNSSINSYINKRRPLSSLTGCSTIVSGFIFCFYLFSIVPYVYAQQALHNYTEATNTHKSVYEKVLSNGLKIIVKPDHRSPVVVFQTWYKVGSSYEYSGITGVSHAMEHMMQKGMKEFYNLGFINRLLPGIGDSNAFSSRDYTTYYHLLEKNRLADIFHLEAWRMRTLSMSIASFETEMKVIQEERRQQIEDIPEALLYEQFNALAYNNSGYQQPIIGWMTDLNNLQFKDLKHWYQQYYTPDNTIIVVVGDVDSKQVFRLAEHYFSHIKPSLSIESVKSKPRHEPPQKGTKRFIITSQAKLPYLIAGFKVPSLVTAGEKWESYALDLLASILDSGENSRFNKNLVRHRKAAAQLSVEYQIYAQQQTQFIIEGVPNKGFSASDLEQAVLNEIERLKKEPVPEQELKRIKTQIIASEVYDKDSMFYQAKKIGIAETIGLGWQTDENYVDHILSINSEQLQQVAQKYFISSNLTTALMEPLEEKIKDCKIKDCRINQNKGVK